MSDIVSRLYDTYLGDQSRMFNTLYNYPCETFPTRDSIYLAEKFFTYYAPDFYNNRSQTAVNQEILNLARNLDKHASELAQKKLTEISEHFFDVVSHSTKAVRFKLD